MDIVDGHIEVDLFGVHVGVGDGQLGCVAHQGQVQVGDIVQITVAVGGHGNMGHIEFLFDVGIHTGVDAVLIALILREEDVGILVADHIVLTCIQVIPVAALVQDGSIGPVAVEAQVGQAQVHTAVVQGGQTGEAFHIAAVGPVGVEVSLVLSGQVHIDSNGSGGTGSHLQNFVLQVRIGLVAHQGIQVSLDVGSGNSLVGIHIIAEGCVHLSAVDGSLVDDVGIVGIGVAVVVHVMSQHHVGGGLRGGSAQQTGGTGHEVQTGCQLQVILGLGGGIQAVVSVGIGEVGDVEAEAVCAGAVGIVAQVSLDGICALHAQVGIGGHGIEHIAEACALGAGRIGDGFIIAQGSSGAHQQVLGDHAVVGALGEGFLHILHDQRGHTGDVGSGHGGTGHEAVLTVVDGGVDIAAGGGDIRSQSQVRSGTHGGEIAHGVGQVGGEAVQLVGEGDLQLVIFFHRGDQVSGICQGDGSGRGAAGAAGHIHAEFAGGVVVHQGSDGTGSLSILMLLQEAQLTALDQSHLAFQIQALEISGGTQTGNQHYLVGAGEADQVGQAVGLAGIIVGNVVAVGIDVGSLDLPVLHRSHGHGVGIGAGGAHNTVVGMPGGVHIGAPVVGIGGVVVVAGGDGQNSAGGSDGCVELIQEVAFLGVLAGGEACGRTQGQVDHVSAQHQGIFQSGQNVHGESAAVVAEDLHDEYLGIGSHTHNLGALDLVGGGDTGNMGAVVAEAVHVVDDQAVITVVEAVDHLGAVVNVLHSQAVVTGAGIQAAQNRSHILSGDGGIGELVLCQGGKVLVIGVQTGIDDGDLHALAGIAVGPGGLTADHHTVGDGVGSCHLVGGLADGVNLLQHHGGNTLNGLDLGDLAEGHGGSHTVQQPGVLIMHIQLLTVHDFLLDLVHDGGLLLLHVLDLAFQLHIQLCRGVLLNNGLALQDDDDLHHLVGVHGDSGVHGFQLGILSQLQLGIGELFKLQLLDFSCPGGSHGSQRKDHAQGQNSGKHSSHIHNYLPPFFFFSTIRAATPIRARAPTAATSTGWESSPVSGFLPVAGTSALMALFRASAAASTSSWVASSSFMTFSATFRAAFMASQDFLV